MSSRFAENGSMSFHMKRLSVVDQVAATLRDGIVEGEWEGWLPAERQLCANLHVGRNTLRTALKALAGEKLIEIVPGEGSRILRKADTGTRTAGTSVGLLTPGPIEMLFPRQVVWIDDLRAQLAEQGLLLQLLHGQQYFRPNPGKALRRLIQQHKCDCWILVYSNSSIQSWFEASGAPALIAGSCHAGVHLPYVDIDYRALCRHAANTFIRLGHRNIAFLTLPPEHAGDICSESGFMEGIDGFSKRYEVRGKIVHHDESIDRISKTLRRMMRQRHSPTALLIHNSYLYLGVFSTLTQMGFQIPEDISIICRDSETFLPYVRPRPACYVQDPHQFATKLARIVGKVLHQPDSKPATVHLMPEFIRGASIKRAGQSSPVHK